MKQSKALTNTVDHTNRTKILCPLTDFQISEIGITVGLPFLYYLFEGPDRIKIKTRRVHLTKIGYVRMLREITNRFPNYLELPFLDLMEQAFKDNKKFFLKHIKFVKIRPTTDKNHGRQTTIDVVEIDEVFVAYLSHKYYGINTKTDKVIDILLLMFQETEENKKNKEKEIDKLFEACKKTLQEAEKNVTKRKV